MPATCVRFDMSIYFKITDCGNSICKDYYFILLLIDVKLSSSSKDYLCKSNLRKSCGVPHMFGLSFHEVKTSEKSLGKKGIPCECK
jgi:hypothetical protein